MLRLILVFTVIFTVGGSIDGQTINQSYNQPYYSNHYQGQSYYGQNQPNNAYYQNQHHTYNGQNYQNTAYVQPTIPNTKDLVPALVHVLPNGHHQVYLKNKNGSYDSLPLNFNYNNIQVVINNCKNETSDPPSKVSSPSSTQAIYECPREQEERQCVLSFRNRPMICEIDQDCKQNDGLAYVCCYDKCLEHKTCKPPLIRYS